MTRQTLCRLTAASLKGLSLTTSDLILLIVWGAGSVLSAVLLSFLVLRQGLKKLTESGF